MGTQSNPPGGDDKERRPAFPRGLRPRTTCRARYGRATLAIRRWGGLDELVGQSDVAKKADAFRTGQATAEEVAWAFVRARIANHSPTFRWQSASLDRLIPLVSRCSDEPHLTATTPAELANELIKAQDEQTEMLSRMSKQFSGMFSGVSELQSLLSPQLTMWAEQNQRTFADFGRKFADLSQSTFDVGRLNPLAGLTPAMRREMFPILQPTAFQALALAGLPTTVDRLHIRLPDAAFSELSTTLQRSLNLYDTQTVAPALRALTQHQMVTVADVLAAAREAAGLAAREGQSEAAAELVELSHEVAEVIAHPSTETLEEKITDLSERFDDFRTKYEQDQTIALFLWFLAIYMAVFLYLLEQLGKS